jgi:hypothetical protein
MLFGWLVGWWIYLLVGSLVGLLVDWLCLFTGLLGCGLVGGLAGGLVVGSFFVGWWVACLVGRLLRWLAEGHSSCRTQYLHGSISCYSTHIAYKLCQFGCDRPVIKGNLLQEQSTITAVYRLPFHGFSQH